MPTGGEAARARFYLALGAVGYLRPAAELAGVSLEQARAWVEGLERPAWTTRRSEAALRLFAVATEALELARQALRGEAAERPGLRELVMVAERFYAAALRLDKDVAADGDGAWELDLGGWSAAAAVGAATAGAASGAGDGVG